MRDWRWAAHAAARETLGQLPVIAVLTAIVSIGLAAWLLYSG